jgi:hypothetical protein
VIGADYHSSVQHVAFLNQDTGECGELCLNHSDGEAEQFCRDLKKREIRVRVGMEAIGYSRWFERLLAELGSKVWIGDPTEIKTRRVKKPHTNAHGCAPSDNCGGVTAVRRWKHPALRMSLKKDAKFPFPQSGLFLLSP